ncbi:MAG: DUF3168 domain-containing protein [Rhizobiales bacterium]|nr:DUF3168 domain-containing protein [Hyphomicrobiales bacterium]NRB15041.1 DUF3168 domain-containing protein [Hyphomicrobiales bacterium]
MSLFTVPLAEAVIAALKAKPICAGRVHSFVPKKETKPYVLVTDFNGRYDHAQGVYVVNEQFSIKIFDDAETLKKGMEIRQEITEILTDEAFEVAGAGLVLMSVISEIAGFDHDGDGSETFARFNALLHKELDNG